MMHVLTKAIPSMATRRRNCFTTRIQLGLLAILLTVAAPVTAIAERTRIPLAENWHVRQLDGEPDVAQLTREIAKPDDRWLATRIPAQVHDVLLKYGKIPDPRIGKNAAECTWVGERDWVYACTFRSPERNNGPVFLCFDGLDTLANAYLNGRRIAHKCAKTFQVKRRQVVVSKHNRYAANRRAPRCNLRPIRREDDTHLVTLLSGMSMPL